MELKPTEAEQALSSILDALVSGPEYGPDQIYKHRTNGLGQVSTEQECCGHSTFLEGSADLAARGVLTRLKAEGYILVMELEGRPGTCPGCGAAYAVNWDQTGLGCIPETSDYPVPGYRVDIPPYCKTRGTHIKGEGAADE